MNFVHHTSVIYLFPPRCFGSNMKKKTGGGPPVKTMKEIEEWELVF